MVVKTFRGLLADGGQDRIRLSTIKGKVGYKIVKFQIFPNQPGQQTVESTVTVWKTDQSPVSASSITVNFTDSDLLAAAFYSKTATAADAVSNVVVFDQEIFNQDIFIAHVDTNGTQPGNYYLELEVIPLDDAGAEYTTLKDMRQS